MRKLYVIGIGAGDPDQVTMQAVKAMRAADAFFVIGKGDEKRELVEVRTAILAEHVPGPHRIIEITDPPRERTPDDYAGVVRDWHERRAELLGAAFDEVDGTGAILVWGDPALYDSTLRMVELVLAGGRAFDYEVIPGVTSVAALAARHRMVLHRIGEPVHVTTGRRLREDGLGAGSTVVMLDRDCSFTEIPADDVHIWWGAYLGMPDETLIEGPLAEVGERIVTRRAELRAAKGWVMDVYLLRRR
ncbi:precorrin-6A synthase (deacetylating) [Nocardia neocaledoniensis]|uniref:precorrin-6A synthase (deacetylating) n=1 Tax=Nocardia neocaledoniensis TaxID=236511 RepID=UPI0024569A44|nr:precorrin-6A synthase (deacetylating) [Nocardia neocaledoniensis]